jgi:putative SOS response-associated peptidase YedK
MLGSSGSRRAAGLRIVLDDPQFDDWMRGTSDQPAEMMEPYAGEIEAWEVGAAVGTFSRTRSSSASPD